MTKVLKTRRHFGLSVLGAAVLLTTSVAGVSVSAKQAPRAAEEPSGAIRTVLETTGPLLLRALKSQDMYLAGSFLMFLAFLTVIGVLISDLALAVLDPRIRLQGGSTK